MKDIVAIEDIVKCMEYLECNCGNCDTHRMYWSSDFALNEMFGDDVLIKYKDTVFSDGVVGLYTCGECGIEYCYITLFIDEVDGLQYDFLVKESELFGDKEEE